MNEQRMTSATGERDVWRALEASSDERCQKCRRPATVARDIAAHPYVDVWGDTRMTNPISCFYCDLHASWVERT